jgi:hypothetical protein
MTKSLEAEIRERAGGRCEYCQLPEHISDLPHVIDHVIARQHRGATVSGNLALCCGRCNLSKGPNVAGVDPVTGEIIRLFHPRTDHWADHFEWRGPQLHGRTAIGRTTIEVLAMNHPYRVAARQVESWGC